MPTGFEYDKYKALESLAYNTRVIAEQLASQNKHLENISETLRGIQALMALIYKNGIPTTSAE